MIVALVGCGKTKLDAISIPGGAPAKDLYTGGLFKKARAFAEKHAGQWFILSARFGLVKPTAVLPWYNTACSDLSRSERAAWAADTRASLARVVRPRDVIVFLAGECYAGAVEGFPHVEMPLEGLGIGDRLKWLKEHT